MKSLLLLNIFLIFSSSCLAERVRTVRTHTRCCFSRSLDNDSINWIPGQTDVFTGPENLEECADYEVGAGPFTLTAFHDGVDGLTIDWIEVETDARTVKCYIDHKLDDHSFVKSHCN